MKANDKETEKTEVNEEDASDSPKNDLNINNNSDDKRNAYEVTPDTTTNGGNNDEEKNYEEEAEK